MDTFTWDAFWTALTDFGRDYADPLRIATTIIFAVILRFVLRFVIDRAVNQVVSGVKKRQSVDDTAAILTSPLAAVRVVQRTRTLGSVLNNIVTAVIVVVAATVVLTILVPNITSAFALVTAALGAGLGFGAQNIIKDVLNGLFMVAEDQLGVGDVVDLGPATGVVEAVGIRITQIRDVNGTVWFVRNGEILRVGNMSQGWSRVIIDLAVPYEVDVQTVQERMLATAVEMQTNTKWRSRILERPEIWGIESISADAIIIRIVVKTRAGAKDDVARDLRLRLKETVDEMGIQLPSLNSVVLSGFEGAESINGSRPPRTRPVATSAAPPAKPVKAAKTPRAPRNPKATPSD